MERIEQVEGLALIASALALCYAGVQTALLLRASEGTERMRSIAAAIREGSSAFLRREYAAIALVGLVIAAVMAVLSYAAGSGISLALGFLFGAAGSAVAGAVGVMVSVRANVRTAARACDGSLPATMRYAFRAGSVAGLSVAGIAVLELAVAYLAFGRNVLHMAGLLFGASLVSLFARVGGGIYTKGADVGADLVGKVETRIPEDDPRNPAVIADNVGDNVGDCAGMAADLFETYLVTAVGTMLLGELIPDVRAAFPNAVLYPIAVSAWGLIATLFGIAFVRMRPSGSIMGALYRGLAATVISGLAGMYGLDVWLMNGDRGVFLATATGLVVVVGLVVLTSYYTSSRHRPVERIATSAEAGAGPVVISGLAVGLASVWLPGLLLAGGTLAAFSALGWTTPSEPADTALAMGLYGIGLAAVSMLAVTGMILSIDAFGPITDNAGGIAEMAGLSEGVRKVTDPLDAVGNTTKAITKGYAIGSAALGALCLFAAYTFAAADTLGIAWTDFTRRLTIDNPLVVVGLLLGALLPFFFTSFLMNAVSVAAHSVVLEVRRQFKEIAGILEGTAKPDYERCVGIVTVTALRQLIVPGVIAVATPLAVGFLLGPVALAGLVLGVILSGLPLALLMTTSGAAWDNAKKYIESGQHGGKQSRAHHAAVVGDTVGDATKDTAGPAINPLVKVVNTVAILLVSVVATHFLIHP